MRPVCLIGSFCAAEAWIISKFASVPDVAGSLASISSHETLILKDDITVDEIKFFRQFLFTSSLSKKLGIVFFFNKLNSAKQAVLLKIFEELPEFSRVVLHSSTLPPLTIHTRCDLFFLQTHMDSVQDLDFLLAFLERRLLSRSLSLLHFNGMRTFLEVLGLFSNGFLSLEEKNILLNDLKGL